MIPLVQWLFAAGNGFFQLFHTFKAGYISGKGRPEVLSAALEARAHRKTIPKPEDH
jgi:hypothetical protein